jgi:hypothetical protein
MATIAPLDAPVGTIPTEDEIVERARALIPGCANAPKPAKRRAACQWKRSTGSGGGLLPHPATQTLGRL